MLSREAVGAVMPPPQRTAAPNRSQRTTPSGERDQYTEACAHLHEAFGEPQERESLLLSRSSPMTTR